MCSRDELEAASPGQRGPEGAIVNKTVDFWPLSLLQPFAWLEASIPPCVKPIRVLPAPEQGGFPGVIGRRLSALNGIYETTVMSPSESP